MDVLFENEVFLVKYYRGKGDCKKRLLRITFNAHIPDVLLHSGKTLSGESERLLVESGVPAIFVIEKKNIWWNNTSFLQIISKIKEIRAQYVYCVAIGASIGGYGAIRFSKDLNVDFVIAFSPQYSANPKICPFETRWQQERAILDFSRETIITKHNTQGEIHVILDSNDTKDVLHSELLFKNLRSCHLFYMPFSGHSSARALYDIGALERIVLAAEDKIFWEINNALLEWNQSCRHSSIFVQNLSALMRLSERVKFIENALVQTKGHPRHKSELLRYLENCKKMLK